MRLAVLEVAPPRTAWCSQVGHAFPEVEITVQSHFFLGASGSLEIVRLHGRNAAKASEEIPKNPLVSDFEVLDRDKDDVLVRMRVRGCLLPFAVERSGVLPTVPYEVREGCHRWCVLGQGARLDRFAAALRSAGADVNTVYVGEEEAEDSLTARQREILRKAVDEGYYDVPRRTSLSGLAQILGVSKASLCETIQVIEKKVMRRVEADPLVSSGG